MTKTINMGFDFESFCLGSIFGVILAAIVALIKAPGKELGETSVRAEAVAAGVAYYSVNTTNGVVTFNWGINTNR